MLFAIQSEFRDREPILRMLLGYSGRFVNGNNKHNTIMIKETKNKVQWELRKETLLLSRETNAALYFHL